MRILVDEMPKTSRKCILSKKKMGRRWMSYILLA